eukprot:TRINITY_DN23718_c0_g2_i1.p1 TRINITY_DN23718_c0_g2~~TRINITY_DN23718_c0_g2_i1.p1  ORF type:complete len:885 (+),score=153.26 TRINITY_DN23718_c0_g2_i1:31-2685(+)
MLTSGRDVARYFRRFDLNGDGCIDRSELGQVLSKIDSKEWPDGRVDRLFRILDTNGSGVLDYEEFVGWAFGHERVRSKDLDAFRAAVVKPTPKKHALPKRRPSRSPSKSFAAAHTSEDAPGYQSLPAVSRALVDDDAAGGEAIADSAVQDQNKNASDAGQPQVPQQAPGAEQPQQSEQPGPTSLTGQPEHPNHSEIPQHQKSPEPSEHQVQFQHSERTSSEQPGRGGELQQTDKTREPGLGYQSQSGLSAGAACELRQDRDGDRANSDAGVAPTDDTGTAHSRDQGGSQQRSEQANDFDQTIGSIRSDRTAPLDQLDHTKPLDQLDQTEPLDQLDRTKPLDQLDQTEPLDSTKHLDVPETLDPSETLDLTQKFDKTQKLETGEHYDLPQAMVSGMLKLPPEYIDGSGRGLIETDVGAQSSTAASTRVAAAPGKHLRVPELMRHVSAAVSNIDPSARVKLGKQSEEWSCEPAPDGEWLQTNCRFTRPGFDGKDQIEEVDDESSAHMTERFGLQDGIDELGLKKALTCEEFRPVLAQELKNAGFSDIADVVVPSSAVHGDGIDSISAELAVLAPLQALSKPEDRQRFRDAVLNAVKACGRGHGCLPDDWDASIEVMPPQAAKVSKSEAVEFFVEVAASETSGQQSALQNAEKIVEGLNASPELAGRLERAKASRLRRVDFELYWGYPKTGKDFLDGAALAFAGQTLLQTVDYRAGEHEDGPWKAPSLFDDGNGFQKKGNNCEVASLKGLAADAPERSWAAVRRAVRHSGDYMNDESRMGKQTMQVDLALLPKAVDTVFFILAAYHCDDISLFPSPQVRLCNTDRPDHHLMEYKIEKAGASQALVMCALSKSAGSWQVDAIGSTCQGNVTNYTDLMKACRVHLNAKS